MIGGARRRLAALPLGLALALTVSAAAGTGCRHTDGSSVLVVVVTIQGSPPPVVALDVVLSSSAGTATRRYTRGGRPIVFPTTLSAEVLTTIKGDLSVDVTAFDAGGGTVARGRQGAVSLRAASTRTITVALDCTTCSADGGVSDGPVGSDSGGDGPIVSCGNGRVDIGETCDNAIAPGQAGACPTTCDDGIACSIDTLVGSACTVACQHSDLLGRLPGDGCCPSGASNLDDSDCASTCGNGVVDATETCDSAIAAGLAGACPSQGSCVSDDPCVTTLLISEATCEARCLRFGVTAPSGAVADGCCPDGLGADVDVDCASLCGNGVLDPGELCDPGIATPRAGACPASCDDGNPCTTDQRIGVGCQAICTHSTVTSFASGDGCCPSGSNRNLDTDCPAVCGNGSIEEGEACDFGAASPAPCPATCPASPSACLKRTLAGDRDHCTSHCTADPVTDCSAQKDGCCPSGCTAATDADCSPGCGDGTVDPRQGETCDTAIAAGRPGACPTRCTDGLSCTTDILVSAGTCQAACVFIPITSFAPGDACCPAGGHFAVDPDCTPVCGNGVVELPGETCDFAAGTGACPTVCPPATACSAYTLRGTTSGCDAQCVSNSIDACVDHDGCCPPTCSALTDSDCPALCGNGLLEPGEACDTGITVGILGACPGGCDDHNACTVDFASGLARQCTRRCVHAPISECVSGDHCCPPGCSAANDGDCGGGCGDGIIGGGETCDPPSSCPTTCPDDGDRCTAEQLVGDPARCTAACAHVPITACSGATSDRCCPTGCTPTTDSDC